MSLSSVKRSDILIVDDKPENLKILRELLVCEGYQVRTAINGRLALRSTESKAPDLIILDIRMPVMDGFEVCQHLKAKGNLADIPVIFISGLTETEDKIKAFQAGGVDYIIRPFQTEEVLMRVKTHLKLHGYEKELRQRARTSEDKYRGVVEDTSLLICSYRSDGEITFVNKAYCDYFDRTSAEVVGSNFMSLIPEKDRQAVMTNISSLTEASPTQSHEHPIITTNGDIRWQRWTNRALFDARGKVVSYQAIGEDITERKKSEEEKKAIEAQLQHIQKMEDIGTLAGGIAHDFNNILSSVIGYSENAIDKLKEIGNHDILDDIRNIFQASLRAKDLVLQILQFSRYSDTDFKPCAIAPLFKEVLRLLRASQPATIEIVQNIRLKSEKVLADATQLHQVMVNLCTNAFHAMRESGGTLTIGLAEEEIPDPGIYTTEKVAGGKYAVLSVRDTGCGMEKGTLKRLFEPYFTTKEIGEGTGLGLAVTSGIVKSHKGFISVRSTPGEGSEFKVFFPILQFPERKEVADLAPIKGGHERILFVDDESFFVDLSCKVLTDLGYRVDSVYASEKALELFSSRPDQYDILVTDQTMPKMTGLELIERVHRIRPDLPTIICSGFSEFINNKTAQQIGVSHILYKPSTKRDLALAIRRVLDNG